MKISVYDVPFQPSPEVNIGCVDIGVAVVYHGVNRVYSASVLQFGSVSFYLYQDDKSVGVVSLFPEQAKLFKAKLSGNKVFVDGLPIELAIAC